MLVGAGYYLSKSGRDWTEEELKSMRVTREQAPTSWWGRAAARTTGMFDWFIKPAWDDLLPPKESIPFSNERPYTLVLSLDDLLVSSVWDRQNGWRTAKRPGVDYFLRYLSQFYEIVIFTSQNSYTAEPILEALDRYMFYISFRLFRESTHTIGSKVVKDLSYLNRDLSKVIVIDTHPDHVSAQPENAILLPKWKVGQDDPESDGGLVAFIPFLESIAIYRVPDVRPLLKAYEGKDIPLEYAKMEAADKQRHLEKWAKDPRSRPKTGHNLAHWAGLDISKTGERATAAPPNVPLTYLEAKRREAQLRYLDDLKFVEANSAKLEKLREEDRQAAMADVPGSLLDVVSRMRSGTPPPGSPNAETTSEKSPEKASSPPSPPS
ncbi:HAD-like protein [Fistulina hepatica ATCC 64428]|uniref:Mitochondrial import inner membrane translocase subunit TIM50 n=1 Tax=Fistulina hepatica ATCC 64428 TaxID=1128425 RepID=A0A0D7AMH2_9AGAR|nr:HAD-like protein [Fistulina hepatica ATCC 64428]